MLSLINLLLGVGLLILGRRLFWLFVAAGGFLAGVTFATRFLNGPEWLTLLIGIITGIIFAVLAMFLKAFAIGLAGFFLGGSILSAFAGGLGIDSGGINWIIYIIGGVIGIILVALLFDWALITLSSFAGAALIVQGLNVVGSESGVFFFVLMIIGVIIQGTMMRRDRRVHAG
jgi:hypothetical protein